MTLEAACLISLVCLNVAQFIFWSHQNQILVDKLMSGSFGAYKAAETIGKKKVQAQSQQEVQEDYGLMEDFNRF